MRNKQVITRRQFAAAASAGVSLLPAAAEEPTSPDEPSPTGIWRLRFGTPEKLTPSSARRYPAAMNGVRRLPAVTKSPFSSALISTRATPRGYEVSFPLAPDEMIYGLGLQFRSFLQRGLKKKLRVNADPAADLGDSHAPVPFYVSTRGYGILIDTARYLNIYCGNKPKKNSGSAKTGDRIIIEIPEARGVDVYVFAGPTMRAAVQRFNLYAGGGALPPRWGLGFWYRTYGKHSQPEAVALAKQLRESRIPCDVFGLEPGWQSHAYSCSFVWSDKFPQPQEMLDTLNAANYHVNLWEHAFTHPSSPLYQPLLPHSGDYEVWGGLVPDFLTKEGRGIFGDYHERTFVANGVSGFKLDECDNSDYTGCWSFPELSKFPSGADGEQMHSLFGLRYQDAIQGAFDRRKIRTFGLVRSSHAFAAPYPYALYSDLYDHKEFIRGVASAGFSGLLWCPEVRDARDTEDLIRRLQTAIFSPLAMVNAWYIKNPPWKQVDRQKNNANEFSDSWQQVEDTCRRLIELRMQLVPYLYAAYVRYHLEGIPPFRAVVMDHPDDPQTWKIDDQYLAGESMLIAPITAGQNQRSVYLPEGEWFDFWTASKIAGKQRIDVSAPLDRIPVFLKSGTLMPLATPTLHVDDPAAFELIVRAYGSGNQQLTLYEDDGTPAAEFTRVTLTWNADRPSGSIRRSGRAQQRSYSVKHWERVT
ncbi:MAG TPA: TIM-barrel domain-containing protein [Bryobacteraceae bacterium]